MTGGGGAGPLISVVSCPLANRRDSCCFLYSLDEVAGRGGGAGGG